MAPRKRAAVDLTGIRQRGGTFQVRVFIGNDPVTGKKVMVTGSADTQSGAIELRDEFRKQVREQTAVRTGVTLGYLLDEWLAGHQAEATTLATYRFYVERFLRPALGDQTLVHLAQLGPRPYEQLYAQLRHCRRRCQGRKFIEHRTSRPHECDPRCKPHVCTPLAASSIRQCHAVLSSAYAAATRWGWIAFNPMDTAQKPRLPPRSPTRPRRSTRRASWLQRGSRTTNGAWSSGRHSSPAPAAGSCSRSGGRTSTSAAAR